MSGRDGSRCADLARIAFSSSRHTGHPADREPEVRATACKELASVAPLTKSGLLEQLPTVLEERAVDTVINVRGQRWQRCMRHSALCSFRPPSLCAVSLAQSLCSLVPHLGKETSSKILVPLIQQLCKVGSLLLGGGVSWCLGISSDIVIVGVLHVG